MPDEIIDICNEKNEIIGTISRSEAHRKGLWHRTVHVWMYNSKGQLLLQLRSAKKDFFPNMWDIAVAGHITTGESISDVALRETEEELGLEIQKEDLEFIGVRKQQYTYKDIIENVFHYVHLLKIDEERKFQFQDEEVQDIRFISLEKLEEELVKNPNQYTPRGNYWNDIIAAIKLRV